MWQGIVFLFCASIFTSKSGLSIFGLVLLLVAAFKMDWKEFFKRKDLVFAISLYPLAAFCNLFSLGGWQSSVKVLISWPWPLLVIPAFYISRRPQDWKAGLAGVFTGFIIACGNALWIFFHDFGGQFNSAVRVASFWDIGRWGTFLSIAGLCLFALYALVEKANKRLRYFSLILFVVAVVCLVLANTRAPWLAFGVGFSTFCLLTPRYLKHYAALILVALALLLSNEGFRSRISSIGAVKKSSEGHMTSSDASNTGRLNMWKVALDFYKEQPLAGTGWENVEAPLRSFLNRQSTEYRDTFTQVEFSYRDQHSSYLSMLVQMGVVFFTIFWLFVIGFVLKTGWQAFAERSSIHTLMFSVFIAHLVMFVFYGSVSSYEMVTFFPFLALGNLPPQRAKRGLVPE